MAGQELEPMATDLDIDADGEITMRWTPTAIHRSSAM